MKFEFSSAKSSRTMASIQIFDIFTWFSILSSFGVSVAFLGVVALGFVCAASSWVWCTVFAF